MTILNGLQHIGIPTDSFEESEIFYKNLGFELINEEQNGESKVGFFKLGNFVIEIWEALPTKNVGAIHHIALDTDDIESAYKKIQGMDVDFIDNEIMVLPFWGKGIKYFNFYGPNREILEICQIIKG